jgi:hypothetical protein
MIPLLGLGIGPEMNPDRPAERSEPDKAGRKSELKGKARPGGEAGGHAPKP